MKAEFRTAINNLKLERGCTDCGYKGHPHALEFDHIPSRGMKSYNVSEVPGYFNWDQIMREIKKCEVVCANCHRIRTVRRRLYA